MKEGSRVISTIAIRTRRTILSEQIPEYTATTNTLKISPVHYSRRIRTCLWSTPNRISIHTWLKSRVIYSKIRTQVRINTALLHVFHHYHLASVFHAYMAMIVDKSWPGRRLLQATVSLLARLLRLEALPGTNHSAEYTQYFLCGTSTSKASFCMFFIAGYPFKCQSFYSVHYHF